MPQQLTTMESWYQSVPGSYLLDFETHQLSRLLQHIQGEYLLQIGGPRHFALIRQSSIKYKIYLNPNRISPGRDFAVQGNVSDLPLSPDSIDLIVLPHMLEFVYDPQQTLAEVYQTLIGQGQVVILGFNAMSLWGLTRLKRGKRGFPWHGYFRTPNQVKRWLRNVGFRIVASRTMMFRSPIHDDKQRQNSNFNEALGQLCMPWFGSIYLITAQKRVTGMTPIVEPKWQKKVAVPNGYAEPTTRHSHRKSHD